MNKQRYLVILLNSLALAFILILLATLQPMTAAGAPSLQGSTPVVGNWTGTTNRGQPMSFEVKSGGTRWDNFKLKATGLVGSCNVTLNVTVSGPGPITNNRFSFNGVNFSFTGQFRSSTTASGTYNVKNVYFAGCGFFSQSGTWTARNGTPLPTPVSPSNLTALALSPMQILLRWNDNSNNETGFKIEQSLTGSGGWTQIAITPATSHAPAGLNCNTRYYYRVRAYNSSGNSSYSNTATAKTLACPSGDKIYLPLIFNSSQPPPPGSPPIDRHWTGTTSRGQPMSFDVSSAGGNWSNFKLKTDFSVGGCSGTIEITVGPGTINNHQFSHSGSTFSFAGQFSSATTASGTYSFVNQPGCGTSFSQTGTWTANGP